MWLAFWSLGLALITTGCGVHFNGFLSVSLSATSLSWHKVAVGHTSGAQVITVTNTSITRTIAISSIAVSPNFIEAANTCPAVPATLPAGATCTISVAFRPTTSGVLTGTLSIDDNAANSPQLVTLTGTGSIGSLLFEPTSLQFPGVPGGSVSQPQTAKLINEQSTPITLNSIVAGGHFSQGNNCPISPETLAAGESCDVTVTFEPLVSGAAVSAVNATDNYGNVTQLYLSGSDTGTPIVGSLSFSPPMLVWGKVAVGNTAASKTVTVTNTQTSNIVFADISVSPGYILAASTCPSAPSGLAPGASCTVSLMFRPDAVGTVSGGLTFTDNGTGSPQTVSLSGTGTLGSLLFTPTSLSFAGVDPGTTSPAQTAVLTNELTSPLTLTKIVTSGPFSQTNNCPSVLGPQASCGFQVTSRPIANGITSGSVNVLDGSGGSTQLYLKGQGGGDTQVVSFSPDTLSWGKIAVGQTSGTKTLTVNNGQAVPLTISSISIGADFVISTSACPTAPETLAAGASCTLGIAFRPKSAGVINEAVTFSDDAPGGTQSVPLSGTGTIGSLLFNPTSLTFASVPPQSVSSVQTASLTNTLSTSIALAAITTSGHFAQTNDCPATLAPQASCTFSVTSDPVVEGTTSGSINVKDGSGVTTQLYLSGSGGVVITPQH
jgi:hypothetical protein